MVMDLSALREKFKMVEAEGLAYFGRMPNPPEHEAWEPPDADRYWLLLDDDLRQVAATVQADLIDVVRTMVKCMEQAPLLTEADRRDLGKWTKSMRASLRLRSYDAWDMEVLHDEGRVLGVQPPGQSDAEPARPDEARRSFQRDALSLSNLLELLDVSPAQLGQSQLNPQATVRYEPDTAFVMMQIDPNNPHLEDVYATIKECFSNFGVQAKRADEIEHQGVITSKITERIKLSEFLFADLSGERPSVYYEVGYAHALGRKVIMYRAQDVTLHFDLAAYNCPEYVNLLDLRKQLTRRLEHVTNRKANQ